MINGNNEKISVKGSVFSLAAFACPLGDVVAQEVDLASYQGQIVRIYLDRNLLIRINPKEDMYWQLAEMSVPAQQSHQVQLGTIKAIKTERVMVLRGEKAIDVISGLDGKEIINAGHYWQHLQNGIDWQAEATGVRWIGERSPKVGEEYPVELSYVSEEPNMITEQDALNLEADEIIIRVFENPV